MTGASSGIHPLLVKSADARLAKARTWDDTNYVLAKSRQTVAWEALGHAVAAYEAAVTYSLRRRSYSPGYFGVSS